MSEIQVSDQCKERLSDALTAALGETVQVARLDDLDEGGANRQSHIKAILRDGRTIGLKAAERVQFGTRREYLLAHVAQAIGVPGSGACGLLVMPAGLPLEGKEIAALQWLESAEQVGKLHDISTSRSSPQTANQLGQWFWLCLAFGVEDRHFGNWVWSEDKRTIAMIDNEDWKPSQMTPERLTRIAEQILGQKLNVNLAREIKAGIQTARERLSQSRQRLEQTFSQYGETFPTVFKGVGSAEIASRICGFPADQL